MKYMLMFIIFVAVFAGQSKAIANDVKSDIERNQLRDVTIVMRTVDNCHGIYGNEEFQDISKILQKKQLEYIEKPYFLRTVRIAEVIAEVGDKSMTDHDRYRVCSGFLQQFSDSLGRRK